MKRMFVILAGMLSIACTTYAQEVFVYFGEMDSIEVIAERPRFIHIETGVLGSKIQTTIRNSGLTSYIPGMTSDMTRDLPLLQKTYVGGIPLLFSVNDMYRFNTIHPLEHLSLEIMEPSVLFPGQDVVLVTKPEIHPGRLGINASALRQELMYGSKNFGVSLIRTGFPGAEAFKDIEPLITTVPETYALHVVSTHSVGKANLTLSGFASHTTTSLAEMAGYEVFSNTATSAYVSAELRKDTYSFELLAQRAQNETKSLYDNSAVHEMNTRNMLSAHMHSTASVNLDLKAHLVGLNDSLDLSILEASVKKEVTGKDWKVTPNIGFSVVLPGIRNFSSVEHASFTPLVTGSVHAQTQTHSFTMSASAGVVHDVIQPLSVSDPFSRLYALMIPGKSVETTFASFEVQRKSLELSAMYKSISLSTVEGEDRMHGYVLRGRYGLTRPWKKGYVSTDVGVTARFLEREYRDKEEDVPGIGKFELFANVDVENGNWKAFLNTTIRTGQKYYILPDRLVNLDTGIFLTLGLACSINKKVELGILIPNLLRTVGYDSPIMAFEKENTIETLGVPALPMIQVTWRL